MKKHQEIIGEKLGRLKVIELVKQDKRGKYYVRCVCDCGNETIKRVDHLLYSKTVSCGCLRREKFTRYKHGMTGTKFYRIWMNLRNRCTFKGLRDYKYYGGRGITYDKSWDKFTNFYNDMYISYAEHASKHGKRNTTIDRINVDGNYCKKNCRWATYEQQANNKQKNRLTKQ